MKKTIIAVVIVLVVGFGIYYITSNKDFNGSPVGTPDTSASVTVDIKNFLYAPETLTVKKGTKVTWINNDAVAHTITSESGSLLDSPVISFGQSFSFTFTNSGTENYYCTTHPAMKGRVIVED